MSARDACRPALLAAVLLAALAGCADDGSSDDSAGGPVGGGAQGGDGGGEGGGPVTGTGGSTARMTIARNFLYAISGPRDVQLFDITTPTSPNAFARVRIEDGLETLFPYRTPEGDDYLLVGAEAGVYILDNSDVGNPRRVGTFEHARAIDPVVARDGYAYVTLRDDSGTVEGANTLSIVDVRDVTAPVLVDRRAMQGPRGLSIGGDRLYVCDGRAGIKSFDIGDPADPVFAGSEPGVDCLDVIATGGRLNVITRDSLLQYDVANDDFVLLSRLGVGTDGDAAFVSGPVSLR